LAENAAKPVRERLTLIRLFEQLRGQGYEGGYDAVRRYARGWRGVPVRLETASVLGAHHHGRKWWSAHNCCGRSKADLSVLTVRPRTGEEPAPRRGITLCRDRH
jgi:hypothetical protein